MAHFGRTFHRLPTPLHLREFPCGSSARLMVCNLSVRIEDVAGQHFHCGPYLRAPHHSSQFDRTVGEVGPSTVAVSCA